MTPGIRRSLDRRQSERLGVGRGSESEIGVTRNAKGLVYRPENVDDWRDGLYEKGPGSVPTKEE